MLEGEGEAAGVEGSEVEMPWELVAAMGRRNAPTMTLPAVTHPRPLAVNSADIPYHVPGTR